mgnify:CR=1 FL=1|tara:strand:- start:4144 stop:4506 length:363 start_codon:yes stop_codon:yes gene_type:complete
MKRNSKIYYFIGFLFLFITEIAIAMYVNDRFIRPYLGDFLVVIMIYCFIMSISSISILKGLLAVLIFSFTLEFLQLLPTDFAHGEKWLRIIMGHSFSYIDLLMYVLGLVASGLIEFLRQN